MSKRKISCYNFIPFKNIESGHYKSKISGQTYATHWNLDLPNFDARLDVESIIKSQEMPSLIKKFSKYEGTCKVNGTYMGKKVTGHATVELINI
jgi:predicted secreted hydrolase